MSPQEIYTTLKNIFGNAILEIKLEAHDPTIIVASEKIKEISLFLRDTTEMQFAYLSCLSGMDYKDTLGVVYHLFSMTKKHTIVLKIKVSRENPIVPSVESIWKTANWHEREAFDLFGIIFTGHSDLRRILLPDDWEGYPLRKDYEVPEFYNGMKVQY